MHRSEYRAHLLLWLFVNSSLSLFNISLGRLEVIAMATAVRWIRLNAIGLNHPARVRTRTHKVESRLFLLLFLRGVLQLLRLGSRCREVFAYSLRRVSALSGVTLLLLQRSFPDVSVQDHEFAGELGGDLLLEVTHHRVELLLRDEQTEINEVQECARHFTHLSFGQTAHCIEYGVLFVLVHQKLGRYSQSRMQETFGCEFSDGQRVFVQSQDTFDVDKWGDYYLSAALETLQEQLHELLHLSVVADHFPALKHAHYTHS